MNRFLRAVAAVCLATGLMSCGGGDSGYGHPQGIPPQFGDSEPHPWTGRTPARHEVHGIDVSRWQGNIDWTSVARGGVSFAYIKATEGGDVADPMFPTNWNAARQAGLPRGAYHYYYFCRTPQEQAAWFIRNVPRDPGALPPVLDIEWTHTSRTCPGRPDPAEIRAAAETFIQILTQHYGQRPVIYTTVDFWRDNQMWMMGHHEFWLRSVAAHPDDIYGHPFTFWQYTGTGRVSGIRGEADLNAFAGSQRDWQAWLARRSVY